MRPRLILGAVMFVAIGITPPVLADDWEDENRKGRWWDGESKDEFRDGPCEVKVESKRGEFKKEIKCKDGIGARWLEGKREFWDGLCKVKIDAKHDEYKEEVKCEGGD